MIHSNKVVCFTEKVHGFALIPREIGKTKIENNNLPIRYGVMYFSICIPESY